MIIGVCVETLCGISLFAFDESISQSQQATIEAQKGQIIALEDRLAARHLDKDRLAEFRLLMGGHSGQAYEIIPYWDDSESLDIANQISVALTDAGWKLQNPSEPTSLMGVIAGIKVTVDKRASSAARGAAKDLVVSLKEVGVDARLGPDSTSATAIDQIFIGVGIKP